MKAILEDVRTGAILSCDVPEPELRPGGILVRTAFSAISAGTERAKVETSEKGLVGKALARPDLVKQVVNFARTNGVKAAYDKVKARLDMLAPMGYSCSGTVFALGEGVTEFQCGDRVACAGGGYANHSEVNWIPSNLAVRVPDGVPLDAASLTTIGAIAMQGLRQAQVNFGESVIVIGAGLVGVLTILLARAAGYRVVAVDLDASRVVKAASFGAQLALVGTDPRLDTAVREFSRYGADAAIVTAATRSTEPVELAARVLRDRGRIVVLGDVGMGVSRPNMYHKELIVAMSRSYGPGRYDRNYEEAGQDYPIGYVRWTERRNMEAFLDLLGSGAFDLSPLLSQRYQIGDGDRAYAELRSSRAYTAIFDYVADSEHHTAAPRLGVTRPQTSGHLRVGCIGAGSFAGTHIFPNLRSAKNVLLDSVATVSGVTAESARRKFGFARTDTPTELLANPHLDAIFITSRHQSHAQYVASALRHGKLVFVEKPLAVDSQQLELVRQAYDEACERKSPFLMVGFNRRFTPATQNIRNFFVGRGEPMVVHVRINAGYIPPEHWTQQRGEGGRIVGELCHFVDWARFVVGSSIRSISATALPDAGRYRHDNLAVVLTFRDGSIANLLYLANGDAAIHKEYFEVFCEGAVARLEDFQLLQLVRNGKTTRFRCARDKGHRNELDLTLKSMVSGGEAPIPFHELVEITEASLRIDEAVTTGAPVAMSDFGAPLTLTAS